MDEIDRSEVDEYATVRITKVVLDNFKSVTHGEIVFDCGRHHIPSGTTSDILGLYGQNGSGKTALIEAISILKHLLSGRRVPNGYSECVAVEADFARLSFEFDFQYPDGRIAKVGYAASIRSVDTQNEEETEQLFMGSLYDAPSDGTRVEVFDEQIRMGGDLDGKRRQYRLCIDTSDESARPFGPDSRQTLFMGKDPSVREELFVKRILASERSQSFIFMDEVLSMMDEGKGILNRSGDVDSDYFTILRELKMFASRYLFVIDSRFPAFASADIMLPFFSRFGLMVLPLSGTADMPTRMVAHLKTEFDATNEILGELIPGLSVGLRELGKTVLKGGGEGVSVALVSIRDGVEIPLRDESDGVKKIISSLALINNAFNMKSATVAIDEFDAGLFEYLLGEMLMILQEYGRGQLIFTSHNLRPLEVLDKSFIWFTTTNPLNRYYRMKNVGATNNLRDMYFREILVGEQDEQLYDSGKRFRIVSALRKAAATHAI